VKPFDRDVWVPKLEFLNSQFSIMIALKNPRF
jgi:hypothetical protein